MAAEASTSEPSEDSLIGSLVSLTSKDGIRYEGIVYYLNPERPSIGLRNVRSFGTEGRKKDGLQVPPSKKVFDFLIFQGSDIEDVLVIGAPVRDDPAIVKSHYSPSGPASTAGSGNISDQSSQAVQPAHPWSTFQDGLPLYQAGKNIESWGSTLPVANCSELGIPMNLQEFYEPTSGLSYLPQKPLFPAPPVLSIPHSLPQRAQFSNTNSMFLSGTLSLHEAACPLPLLVSSTSTSVSTSMQHPTINSLFETTPSFPKFIPPLEPPVSYTPNLISTSLPATVTPTQASLLDIKRLLSLLPNISLVNSHPDSVFGINFPVVPPLGYNNAPGTFVPENNNSIRCSPSNESPSLPCRMISQSMPSSTCFFSSIQGDTLLPSVTPDQLQHPSYSMLPSSLLVQAIHEDAKFKAQEPQSEPLTYELPPPATSMKEPLLPMLPPRRFSEPVTSFSEDFDFDAMNEKFNKAEVWGRLGKGEALVESDDRGQSSNVNVIQEEEKSLNLEIQPAYSKDDFFDTLFSYTFKRRRPSGRTSVPEQLNVNFECLKKIWAYKFTFDIEVFFSATILHRKKVVALLFRLQSQFLYGHYFLLLSKKIMLRNSFLQQFSKKLFFPQQFYNHLYKKL
ncbi:hypothetical protein IEQ34_021469 [Dendrobium chrysotoxum]|uniref:DFDF domain-containing protein n=1 Tax=Dendrobium chrysotoxum TaxID=161865 RepID=A0AAV7G3K5_DENCH|nr:hypothetical protein IEQ34_021469 [Dendrobium chrysotoxum]